MSPSERKTGVFISAKYVTHGLSGPDALKKCLFSIRLKKIDFTIPLPYWWNMTFGWCIYSTPFCLRDSLKVTFAWGENIESIFNLRT